MQIWDTAGQERFQSLGRAFYRGAEACILVYDITDVKSFDNIQVWRQEFISKAMPPDPLSVPFYLIGNKVDRANERKVGREEVEEYLLDNKQMIHFETSALDGVNVNQAFSKVAENFVKTIKEKTVDTVNGVNGELSID